jgi:hypothetical protein
MRKKRTNIQRVKIIRLFINLKFVKEENEMKKLLVLSLAVVMVIAFTLPASALENVFGGYWRTRFIYNENFKGNDDIDLNKSDDGVTRTDTRTRLYYTAILNDNVKLINKFEMDAVWGGGGGRFGDYGDYGADAVAIEVKQTYVDANIGPLRTKIGTHDVTWARGFIYADEFSGLDLIFKAGDSTITGTWMKGFEGGTNNNPDDVDIFAITPVFQFGEAVSLNPFVIYAYSNSGGGTGSFSTLGDQGFPTFAGDGLGVYWVGANADFTLGPVALWATAAYQGGTIDSATAGVDDFDVKAYLGAVGASVPLGPAELHGQFFYASGDDDENDSDLEAFFGIGGGGVGWAYYWSEIMGLGVFDVQTSAGSTVDVSNLWAFNIGASMSPIEKLKLTGDIWYASHVEDSLVTDEKKLGVEVDLKADYQLVEGLNLTVVGAYLFADDATAVNDQGNEDDPYELGAQLSLSF